MKRSSSFVAITTEGGLLPADFLAELLSPKADIDGLTPTSYNLADGERISEQVNRSWNRLKGRWADFKKAIAVKSGHEFTTTETRNRWLQPLFQELGYGQRLSRAKPIEIDGKSYPVSHAWNHVPMHLVGAHIDLDHRTPGVVGAAKASPHSLLQQLLNASDEHLWGMVSNGLNLRLLRDNVTLTRQALVEWDLVAIFDGDLYSEFFLLWLVLHQSRFDAERPEQCWVEKWKKKSEDKGLRALDRLRLGVARSIEALSTGLLSHSANKALRLKLNNGELTTLDFYRQVLRVIYRVIFLLVAEDRELLHLPLPSDEEKDSVNRAIRARQRYRDFYSVGRLRKLTLTRAGTPHSDLWQIFQFVSKKLGASEGCPELALNALGSFLWDVARSTPDLRDARLSNHHFITAVHALTFVQDGSIRRVVDYKNLGSEELGSIYEGLLELHPTINADLGTFQLDSVAGNERKMSGSYYTPDSLVQCLLDSALDPVIANAIRGKQGEAAVNALLNLRICDPAAGSGHFLIAAAHRLAKHVATARSAEDEPGPSAIRRALRDVIGRCIYGVDINPMAVELCKVSLWMEAVEPGKPLSFLDHRIKCGNSLLGATPALLSKGIPEDAFKPIEGDDPKFCSEYRKQNKRERQQQTLLGFHGEAWKHLGNVATDLDHIINVRDDHVEEVQAKEQKYAELVHSAGYEFGRQLADAWCAAFIWKKCPTISRLEYPITNEVFGHLERNYNDAPKWMCDEIQRLSAQYKFFHWHLAFPDVFQVPPAGEKPENELCGWNGGFDIILGNPPWDKLQPEEEKFFASIRPDIAQAKSAKIRKALIQDLPNSDPVLNAKWLEYKRHVQSICHFIKSSGVFPLSGEGNLNTYRNFTELTLIVLGALGRAGTIVQAGLATDETGKELFDFLMQSKRLISFFGFENKRGFFLDVHAQFRFCLLTVGGSKTVAEDGKATFGWLLYDVEEICERGRLVRMSASEIALFNPSSRTCPVFLSEIDLSVSKRVYATASYVYLSDKKRFGKIDFLGEFFNMTRDAGLFHENKDADDFALYEAKCLYQFDHRYATFENGSLREVTAGEKSNPELTIRTKYYVARDEVDVRLKRTALNGKWMVGFRSVSNPTNERTSIATVFPKSGVSNSINLILGLKVEEVVAVLGMANCFVFDYCCRQKISGANVNIWLFKQLPVIPADRFALQCPWADPGVTLGAWLLPRVLELTYTSWDLEGFAKDCNWSGPPFSWDEERRFFLRCELDAAFFHLYALSRDDAAYILDTFLIVRRKDEERFNGDYRTKRVILEIYDEMINAVTRKLPYSTRLDPPPAKTGVQYRPSYYSLPLVLPHGLRFRQADQTVYAMRIILSMLDLSANKLQIATLMNACWLLAKPERLAAFARDIEQDIIAAWSHSFSDTFDPNLFLPTIDELVRRGELNLEREGQSFIVNHVGTMHIVTDPYIEFDALLALRVESSLTETERQSILPLASSQELEIRFKVA